MKAIKYAGILLLTLLILCLFVASAGELELEPRSQAEVMWGLSGVLPRDRAHWVRNFDFSQRVPGIAAMPVDVQPEDPSGRFQPDDLRRLAEICDAVGCRFFFVVEHGRLRENVIARPEGRRRNFQQHFRQAVQLTAYRKAPESDRWERVDPVQAVSEHKDMVGMSDLPQEQLTRSKNQQRCEFLRKFPAETAAQLMGRVLVEVRGRIDAGGQNHDHTFSYMLTNRSPLKLSTIHVWLPVQTPRGMREQQFLFGGDLRRVGTLDPYESATSSEALALEERWRPVPDQARVTIEGWTQEELDNRRSRREGLRVPRSDWKEHENLPPPAHEMDWDTEEGALTSALRMPKPLERP